MYRVTVFNTNATQENPIKPVEIIVSEDKLGQCLMEKTTDHTQCLVALVETY